MLKTAIQNAKLGREEELAALKRLDEQARQLERQAEEEVSLNDLIREERALSSSYGGRSVFGWEEPPATQADANFTEIEEPGGASMRRRIIGR